MNKKNDKNYIKGLLEDSPVFSDIPEVDKLYDMLLRTLQELTVLQEELFAIKLALKKNNIEIDEIVNDISNNPTHIETLIEQHKEMIKKVIGDL